MGERPAVGIDDFRLDSSGFMAANTESNSSGVLNDRPTLTCFEVKLPAFRRTYRLSPGGARSMRGAYRYLQ
jgi:hypothetical protein